MKLKLDADGHVVVVDGKPVYVHDDGKELPFDAPQAMQTISARNAEAKSHREAKEAAETRLKAFEGIEDPKAAREALDKLKNIDAGKLQDGAAVERRIAEAIKAVEDKYAPVTAERDSLKGELYSEKIGGSFVRSKFIAEKVAIPPDFLKAQFAGNFKIEGGKIVPYDSAGNQLFSRANPGQVADFEEAIEILITSHPQRDAILKSTGGGSGAPVNGGGKGGGAKTITRAEFNKLAPAAQAAKVTTEGFAVVD